MEQSFYNPYDPDFVERLKGQLELRRFLEPHLRSRTGREGRKSEDPPATQIVPSRGERISRALRDQLMSFLYGTAIPEYSRQPRPRGLEALEPLSPGDPGNVQGPELNLLDILSAKRRR